MLRPRLPLTRMSRKIRLSLHELVQIVKNNFDNITYTLTFYILQLHVLAFCTFKVREVTLETLQVHFN